MMFACWGWWRRRRHQYRERSLPVLTFVPFLGFGMQSYGGEMALRVFMFALPGAALLAALALFPRAGVTARDRERDRVSLAPVAALLAGLLLMGGYLVGPGCCSWAASWWPAGATSRSSGSGRARSRPWTTSTPTTGRPYGCCG
jgi:hypothetical protein